MPNKPLIFSRSERDVLRVGNLSSVPIFIQTRHPHLAELPPEHPIITPYHPGALSFPIALKLAQHVDMPDSIKTYCVTYLDRGFEVNNFLSAQNRPIDPNEPDLLSLRAHPWMHADSLKKGSARCIDSCAAVVFSNDGDKLEFLEEEDFQYKKGAFSVHTHLDRSGSLTASPKNLEILGLEDNATHIIWSVVVDDAQRRIAITQHYILSEKDHDDLYALLSKAGLRDGDQIEKELLQERLLASENEVILDLGGKVLEGLAAPEIVEEPQQSISRVRDGSFFGGRAATVPNEFNADSLATKLSGYIKGHENFKSEPGYKTLTRLVGLCSEFRREDSLHTTRMIPVNRIAEAIFRNPSDEHPFDTGSNLAGFIAELGTEISGLNEEISRLESQAGASSERRCI